MDTWRNRGREGLGASLRDRAPEERGKMGAGRRNGASLRGQKGARGGGGSLRGADEAKARDPAGLGPEESVSRWRERLGWVGDGGRELDSEGETVGMKFGWLT
eukprot:2927586-Rhodomonas_salina.2